jgi:hypothetical protein
MWPFDQIFPNPADQAEPYLNKVPGTIKPYYDPYINAGQGALNNIQGEYGALANPNTRGNLQGQYGEMGGNDMLHNLMQQFQKQQGNYGGLQNQYSQMMQNPNDVISRLGQGYQKSPGYDWRMKQGQSAINNANAAGGMLGTPQHEQQAGQLAGDLANNDFQQYMDRNMNVMNQGIQGNQNFFNQGVQGNQNLFNQGQQGNQNFYNTGLQGQSGLNTQGQAASTDLGSSLAQALMNQGQLKYAGQANQNNQTGALIGNILSFLQGGGQGGGGAAGAAKLATAAA